MNIKNNTLFRKRRFLAILLLISIASQLLLILNPIISYAEPGSSAEILLKDVSGEVLGGRKLRVYKNNGEQLKFILSNGIYKVDNSGYYSDLTTGENGNVIISNLDIGNYTVKYLKNGEEERTKHFSIESEADFKNVIFTIEESVNGNNDNSSPSGNNSNKELILNFKTNDVSYKIVDKDNNLVKFTKVGNGYRKGGNLDSIKSQDTVKIEGLDAGEYIIKGNGKQYRINFTGGSRNFTINDSASPGTNSGSVIEEDIETGSLDIVIRNKKDQEIYKDASFAIINERGQKTPLTKIGRDRYEYDENGNISSIKQDKKNIKIIGLPVGVYEIVDTSDDDHEFEPITIEILENKTAMIQVLKGFVERDLNLKVFINKEELEVDEDVVKKDDKKIKEDLDSGQVYIDEEKDKDDKSDEKEYLEGFIFTIKNNDGDTLAFKERDEGVYEYTEDDKGEKQIEVGAKGIDLKKMPFDEIILSLKDAPSGYDKDMEDIKIDLSENDSYEYEAKLQEYSLSLIDIENEPIEGVVISVLNSEDKQVFKGISDDNGEVFISNLNEKEDYQIKVISVPSPYALPNQGKTISGAPEGTKFTIKEDINNLPISKGKEVEAEEKKIEEKEDDKEAEKNKSKSSIQIPFASFVAITSSKEEGAIFSFIDKDGEEVYRLVSDKEGRVEIPKMKHGEYVVSQLTVADGYRIDDEKYKLVINDSYVAEEYVFNNPKIGGDEVVENNSNKGSIVLLIIIFVLFILTGLYLSNLKYKEKHGKNKYKIVDKIEKLVYTILYSNTSEEDDTDTDEKSDE